MNHSWTIKKEGDLHRIRRDDGIEVAPARRTDLFRALQPHGIVGSLFDDVCRQLDETGEAAVTPVLLKGGLRQG